MNQKFPRKEIYICTFEKLIDSENVFADNLGELKLDESFKTYAEEKWKKENIGGFSSVMPSITNISVNDKMRIDYKKTEYKYFLGNVKKAIEQGTSKGNLFINGMATEIMPITLDGYFPLERRSDSETQHGTGYYDVPTASQNAEVWFKKALEIKPDLIKNICDMDGFPKWNLIRHLNLQENEIGKISYTGFSKGFEISLAIVIGGIVKINVFLKDLVNRGKNKEKLWYSFEDIPEILNSIGNNGIHKKIKEDIFGRIPKPTKEGFKIIEDTIGTILSNLWRIEGKEKYDEAKKILEKKGYIIKEISPEKEINIFK